MDKLGYWPKVEHMLVCLHIKDHSVNILETLQVVTAGLCFNAECVGAEM